MRHRSAPTVVVIKSYTNFSTGHAFPRLELLVEKSGMSLAQVKRSIKKLVEFGYITKERQGRRNVYRLREKVGITDEQGRPAAVATWATFRAPWRQPGRN